MEIVTEHLILREFRENDLEGMLAYKWDPRYLRFYSVSRGEKTTEDVKKLLQRFLDWQKEEPRIKFQLAITERDNHRMIGNVGVRKATIEARDGEMGCEFAPDYWNRGYATEATAAMLAFGFQELDLHRIWASTMAPNMGARRVLEKLGMKLEGELRETTLLQTGWANSVIYGMLEQEWRDRNKKQEGQDGQG